MEYTFRGKNIKNSSLCSEQCSEMYVCKKEIGREGLTEKRAFSGINFLFCINTRKVWPFLYITHAGRRVAAFD